VDLAWIEREDMLWAFKEVSGFYSATMSSQQPPFGLLCSAWSKTKWTVATGQAWADGYADMVEVAVAHYGLGHLANDPLSIEVEKEKGAPTPLGTWQHLDPRPLPSQASQAAYVLHSGVEETIGLFRDVDRLVFTHQ
jgi:hypothetical protein